jgi:hypothetical protein
MKTGKEAHLLTDHNDEEESEDTDFANDSVIKNML